MTAYRIHYIMPAFTFCDPPSVDPVVLCTTAHLSQFTVRPKRDAKSVQTIARNYRSADGQPLGRLGLMLVPEPDEAALVRDGIPRMCRDALALAYITGGTYLNCHHGQATSVHNSDYFETLPIRFRERGFIVDRPGLLSFTRHLRSYRPSLPPYLSRAHDGDFHIDELLLRDLSRAIAAYRRGSKRPALRQLFRAVAISLHSTRIMPETDSTYFDLGVRITSWVSAFETLVHPGAGRVGIVQVLDLIRQIRWTGAAARKGSWLRLQSPPLSRRRFTLRLAKGQTSRENAACHLYWRLYNLRNDVAHGNPIRPRAFVARLGQRNGPHIDQIAPLLFRECVLERLRQLGIVKRNHERPVASQGD